MDGWLHMSKGVQACRPAYMHACMCKHMQVHIQPDIQKRLYPLVSLRSIMMIKTLHVCMHVSIYSCMDGWLHINKGVQACRPASKHVFVREHMQAHTAC